MERTVIAVDIAKKVFQLHWVEMDTGCIEPLQLKRARMLDWFANRTAALVVMEACGGAHDWGRALTRLGHEVRLISPRKVRPFVQRNKTDAADTQAIWTACQQPGMRFVPVKTDAQQVVLSMHRLRAQLMKTRIMQTNELRGLLYEFGIVLPEGHAALLKALPDTRRDAKSRLPAMLMDSLDEQLRRIHQLQADIGLIERRLSRQMRKIPACKAVAEIPGIGLLTATAVVASMGTPTAFKDARSLLHGSDWSLADRYRWAGTAAGHQQARRCLFANVADARCSVCREQICGQPDMAMAHCFVAAPAVQRGCRRGREQAGADDLGSAGTWSGLAPRGMAGRALNKQNEDSKSTSLKESERPRV